jgi:hypothetical protein
MTTDTRQSIAQTDMAMNWPTWCDRIINRLKWVAAAGAAMVTPLLAWSMLQVVWRGVLAPGPLLPFIAGSALFIVLWRRWLGRSRLGKFAITLEHESTHAVFAVLTGHRIVGFRTSMGRGGEVRFTGEGNWLIVAAPYFFPTAAVLLFLLAYLLPFPGLPWQSFLLGVALGYHIVSTYRETHKDQTDIQQLGLLFCWLFLPAANLAVIGLLTSFAHGGSTGLSLWVSDSLAAVTAIVNWL